MATTSCLYVDLGVQGSHDKKNPGFRQGSSLQVRGVLL
jgi:hypothetical protein